jgi:hypothetical protein
MRLVVLAVCAAGLAACTEAPPPPLSVDPRITIRPDAGVVVARPPTITTTRTGIQRVTIEMQNRNPGPVAVTCTTDWFDASGQPMGGLTAIPTRAVVPAFAAGFCETVSPSPSAVAFRTAIDPSS